jgi:glycosyltransferase involved in cell wall biosynthesis
MKRGDAGSVLIAIPVLLVGGTEMQTLNLVNVLVSAGYKVTVCCYYEYEPDMVKRFEDAGAKVILMKYERAKGLWHLAKGLIQLFKSIKPDIVHVQYIAPGLVPVIAARLAGIKTIFATVHQPGRTYGWKVKFLLRSAARLCTAFFCNSRSVEDSWFGDSELFNTNVTRSSRKHFTIYNAADIERIAEAASSADRQGLQTELGIEGKKVIGFVGRLRWEKGLDILVDAFPHVLMTHPTTVLLVVGDGPDKKGLWLRAKGLGLENNIAWLGEKNPEEVYQLYSVMDIVAVPSRFEGFGLVAAEAMAAGLPVVATKVDGLIEVIENDVTGVLVATSDSAAFASALTGLLSDMEKAGEMGLRGQARAREMFSMEKFSRAMLAAYRLAG